MSPPSMSCTYPHFYTSPISYCTYCSSPPLFSQQQMSTSPAQTFHYSQASFSFSSSNNQAQSQPITSKTARLQYSTKDRYILNELFKRTPYPNAIQRDLIARQLDIASEHIRIWFQNRRRLQTLRDSGERLATVNELTALQLGKTIVDSSELKTLLNEIAKFKNASPRIRLNESS
ncbi:unnamed protein product [Rotaria sordida]|uniref:Homeobox domain-containing protein n=1 Tax=Rotaria sordida TaxID=392033 RepID=A0A813XCA4_9BILA|nr:unnamed protein product [Rotaria sordida]CAF1096175.1 unnamed protein product [Rotaria sordida]